MGKIAGIDNVFYDALGDELRKVRKRRCMSLREVGEQLNCSKQMVDNYECGHARISKTRFEQMCSVLQIPIDTKISVTVKLE